MQNDSDYGKMQHFLHLISGTIADWLTTALSIRGDQWWGEAVYQHLSFAQQQNISHAKHTDLHKLDLAALLRVLDGNWFFLSENYDLDRMVRNYIKEAQNIRNKWAHCDTIGYKKNDIYRDCDTFERLLLALDPGCPICPKLAEFKSSLIQQTNVSVVTSSVTEPESKGTDNVLQVQTFFEVGCMVSPKSSPQKTGVILEKKVQTPENRYTVFIDGRKILYYESQLIPIGNDTEKDLKNVQTVSRVITSSLLAHPSTEFLYSLNSAKIDFVPYQFRPVLKLIRSDRPRLLIADSVGVGKTIEAGLIMRELQVRNSAEKILIICPKPLVTEHKWEQEMRRFDEDFFSLDGTNLKYCIRECNRDGFWPSRYQKCIIPYSLLNDVTLHGDRKSSGLLQLDPPPQWDLVIVDEAHHIRNNSTQAYENVKYFCDNAEAVIFLTATPIQMGNQDLFNLLNLIRPDLVIDQASFIHLIEPNQFINAAASEVRANAPGWQMRTKEFLKSAIQTAWGQNVLIRNPLLTEVQNFLEMGTVSPENRIKLLSYIEEFHTLSGIINRTRRRDIGNFTIRNTKTVEISYNDDQRAVYDELLRFESSALKLMHGNVNVAFLMSTLKRQAASSIFALAPFIDDILNRRIQMLEDIACESDMNFDFDVLDQLTAEAQELKSAAMQMKTPDKKLDALLQLVREKQQQSNNKVMVFSSFRHTLSYLQTQLNKLGIRVDVIHGGVSDYERNCVRQKFEQAKECPDSIDVLLFSEVGCEGLDYQFCDTMINYDLPWNPMRIEQRIGRIDRRGQKSEKILIYNLITAGTIDASIYYRCLSRIGVFEHCIGECDAILGEIQQRLESIANDQRLSELEREEKLQQLADNELRNMQEQQRIEDAAYEFFGLSVPKYYSDELDMADNYWLRAEQLKILVEEYIRHLSAENHENVFNGATPVFTLKMSTPQKEMLLDEYRNTHFPKKAVCKELERYLKGESPTCTVTFDGTYAANHRDVIFISPVHPLVVMAVKNTNVSAPVHTALSVYSDIIPQGRYPFVIYEWEYLGMKPGIKLVPIINDSITEKDFFDLVIGSTFDENCENYPSQDEFDTLDSMHQARWEASLEEYKKQARQIYDFKKSSLTASSQARIALAKEQLNKSSNAQIKIMREAQCRNIEREYQRQIKKFDEALSSLDIRMIPLVYGQIEVKG